MDRELVGEADAALVCFSHLRWGFVWQRPQHLLTRFARHLSVFVVEEPDFIAGDEVGTVRVHRDSGVTILTPLLDQLDAPHLGFNDVTNPLIAAALRPFFTDASLLAPATTDPAARPLVAWYYTPMALGAEPPGFAPTLTVFDAMDELANFIGAPAGLVRREADLMAQADLVFTGGPSLYAARRNRHPHVFCFPSGVDAAHFAPGATAPPVPADLPTNGKPLLGFYGVIDERLDLDLIDAIAVARPGWTMAIIGPVVKIAESDLPERPNLCYLGMKSYADLPAYVAAFDVAILPFALNEATRFISPTKTLEYLAGAKPVVTTPIVDVVDLYGDVVRAAATPTEFVAAVEAALAEPAAARNARRLAAERLLADHAWDAIADAMWQQIAHRLPAPPRQPSDLASPPPSSPPPPGLPSSTLAKT